MLFAPILTDLTIVYVTLDTLGMAKVAQVSFRVFFFITFFFLKEDYYNSSVLSHLVFKQQPKQYNLNEVRNHVTYLVLNISF